MASVFNFNLFAELGRPFIANYKCYSVTMMSGNEREDVSQGGKIFMPPSALEQLTRHNIYSPMIFKITNKATKRSTHCGVLEFIAEEGRVYIPLWMMKNLLLNQGDHLQVESAHLPVATFSKFQAQSVRFLDISNQKAVLEKCLRNFACLTVGDIIPINYNQQLYELCVIEAKPGPAVTIIECDMNVEFISPVGYREPRARKKSRSDDIDESSTGSVSGAGLSAAINDDDYEDDDDDNNDYDNDLNGSDDDTAGIDKDMAELEDGGRAGNRADFDEQEKFQAFAGAGTRLDGKAKSQEQDEAEAQLNSEQRAQKLQKRGVPDFNYEIGSIRFVRTAMPRRPTAPDESDKNAGGFKAFGGKGVTIRND